MASAWVPRAAKSVPLELVTKPEAEAWRRRQAADVRRWLDGVGFEAKAGRVELIPGPRHTVARAVLVVERLDDPWMLAGLPAKLPPGTYHIATPLDAAGATRALCGWILGGYKFRRYKKAPKGKAGPKLVIPKNADAGHAALLAATVAEARDLINTPAEDMGPSELTRAAQAIARRHRAKVSVLRGAALLRKNYPMIHAVGRASDDPPHLIDLTWGPRSAPKVTLVGKGVCFDSGGLDLKPASGMLLMKKDMGGAAAALGLANLIMGAGLPVRLRVLIPAVENSVAGNAFRPLDVIRTRKGLTVEIGNTDAEGRLVLCDALTEACREKPAVLLDFATLTGAARVALGTDLPALFANDDKLAEDLLRAGDETEDRLWRLPLHAPYRKMLDSQVADLNNAGQSAYAGAITAALFLQEFVEKGIAWAHIDTMAWNVESRPGRPVGGEALGIHAAFAMLWARFGGATGGRGAGGRRRKAPRVRARRRAAR